MERSFGNILSELRHSRNLSQRQLASDLHISQALLSHYENGTREPGLSFVCRVCDYFCVSADYMLGRSDCEDQPISVSTALAEFNRALSGINNANVRKAALCYVDSAAKKITFRLTYHDDLQLLEQASAMAEAELSVARSMSGILKSGQ